MARIGECVLVVLVVCVALAARDGADSGEQANRSEKTIRQFEDWDSKNTFPADAVLFVGSSSIRLWPTRQCFPDFPVINRGFGGSQISDVNYFVHRIVLPYTPRVIVFYAGDNDIAAGKTLAQVRSDFQAFVATVRAELPATRVIFVSIKPSGSRWALWPQMHKANEMIKGLCDRDPRLVFVDAGSPLLGSDGTPDDSLYLDDKLHLSAKGYAIWTRLIGPQIAKALAGASADSRAR